MKDKRPIQGKDQWLYCDICLWGWLYDNEMGWVACTDHNNDGYYKKPLDYYIDFWKIFQPKLEKAIF